MQTLSSFAVQLSLTQIPPWPSGEGTGLLRKKGHPLTEVKWENMLENPSTLFLVGWRS